jgi:hypothetical protein
MRPGESAHLSRPSALPTKPLDRDVEDNAASAELRTAGRRSDLAVHVVLAEMARELPAVAGVGGPDSAFKAGAGRASIQQNGGITKTNGIPPGGTPDSLAWFKGLAATLPQRSRRSRLCGVSAGMPVGRRDDAD